MFCIVIYLPVLRSGEIAFGFLLWELYFAMSTVSRSYYMNILYFQALRKLTSLTVIFQQLVELDNNLEFSTLSHRAVAYENVWLITDKPFTFGAVLIL